MKKLTLLLLALVMVLAMVACGNTDETTLPADDATDPVVTEPAETDPVETEPVVTEPVVTEPVVTEPVVTEPVVTEPVETEPAETEPEEAVACTCGNESRSSITLETTDAGFVYKCNKCGGVSRTVVLGNGEKYELDSRAGTGSIYLSGSKKDTLNEYNGRIFGTQIGDSFFLTYNLTISDFGTTADGATGSLTTWLAGPIWGHLIALRNEGGSYRVILGQDKATETETFLELNKDYAVVVEIAYIEDKVEEVSGTSYTHSNAEIYVHMNGEFVGKSNITISRSGFSDYTLRLSGMAGCAASFKDIRLFKPEIDN